MIDFGTILKVCFMSYIILIKSTSKVKTSNQCEIKPPPLRL